MYGCTCWPAAIQQNKQATTTGFHTTDGHDFRKKQIGIT